MIYIAWLLPILFLIGQEQPAEVPLPADSALRLEWSIEQMASLERQIENLPQVKALRAAQREIQAETGPILQQAAREVGVSLDEYALDPTRSVFVRIE